MAKAASAARLGLVSAFVAALGVAPAAAQWRAWFTVTNPANRVASGSDFFSTVGNDPLDYANQADRRNSGFDDAGLTGSVVNGQYTFQTTTTDPNIWLWFPGARGAYPDEGTGARLPIDANTFRIFTVKMTCNNCPVPPTNRVSANIHFYRGPQASEFVITTVNFAVHPGTNIYSFDLQNLPAAAIASVGSMAAPGNWSGTIQGLRFDPADQSGINMSIDWVTLTAPNSSSAAIDWGSFTGSAKIRLFPSNPAGTAPDTTARIGVSRSFCFDGPSCGLSFNLFDFVEPAQPVSGLQTIDTTILGPSTYWIRALSSTNVTIPGTGDEKIVVNTTPSLTLTQPDARGDEGPLGTQQGVNYAFAYRTGHDIWDFTQPNDFEPSFAFDPNEYGTVSIAANPATQCGGSVVAAPSCTPAALSGNWLHVDNSTATLDAGDSQFFPRLGGAPIDTTRYRHLTMKMLLDRPRDREPDGSPAQAGTGNLGAVSRILWFDKKVLGPGDIQKLNVSEDIYIQNGVQEIHVDLYRIRVDPNSFGNLPWSQAGFVRYFRVDPHEYITPTDAYYDEVLLTTNDKSANGQYTISWSNSDPESDAVTITSIALDPDVCGPLPGTGQFGPVGVHCPTQNGNELVIAGAGCTFGGGCSTAPPNTGSFVFNSGAFTAAQVPSGTYWVRIGYSDGRNTAFRYSSGPLDVDRLPPLAQVPMFRLYSASQDYHFFTINPLSRNFAISIGFQDESNPVPFRVENTPTAGSLPLFRMYNPNRGVHFYIGGDVGQRDFNMFLGALYESNEGYLYPLGSGPNPCSGTPGTTELFRLYNNNSGLHLYTASAQQKDGILALFAGIWVQHASVGCVYP